MEIRGIPQKKGKNIYDISSIVCQLYNISIKEAEINYIVYIPTLQPKTEKSIIVAFNNIKKSYAYDIISLLHRLSLSPSISLVTLGDGVLFP